MDPANGVSREWLQGQLSALGVRMEQAFVRELRVALSSDALTGSNLIKGPSPRQASTMLTHMASCPEDAPYQYMSSIDTGMDSRSLAASSAQSTPREDTPMLRKRRSSFSEPNSHIVFDKDEGWVSKMNPSASRQSKVLQQYKVPEEGPGPMTYVNLTPTSSRDAERGFGLRHPINEDPDAEGEASRGQPSRSATIANGTEVITNTLLFARRPTMYNALADDPGWQGSMYRATTSAMFEYISCGVIVLNALILGIEIDYSARHWQDPRLPIFSHLMLATTIMFTVEFCLRVFAHRMAFFCGSQYCMNMLDAIVVIMQWIQCLQSATAPLHGKDSLIWDLSRFFRLISMCRLVRFMRNIQQLRLLMNTIAGSLSSLVSLILVVLLATFVFGAVLTSLVTSFAFDNQDEDPEARELLQLYFGTLDKSMLSLYEAMSDGIHWHVILDPLAKYCSPWWRLAFVFYTAFTMLALMNILQGLFLESAMRIAAEEARDVVIEQISKIFMAGDADGSGTIAAEEFESLLEGESQSGLPFFLNTIGIPREQAMQLFRLLDQDGSGEIDLHEFVHGCERLQGTTRAVDFAVFMVEWRQAQEQLEEIGETLKQVKKLTIRQQ